MIGYAHDGMDFRFCYGDGDGCAAGNCGEGECVGAVGDVVLRGGGGSDSDSGANDNNESDKNFYSLMTTMAVMAAYQPTIARPQIKGKDVHN